MVDMGAEVGQKMRSAIKAKLTELDCYVDDELPDYIMVMVANKRTKTQMNDDLALFLKKKTTAFVDWLHIVLKKLREVTVTNLDVYKNSNKRKIVFDSKYNQKKIKKEILRYSNETTVKEETKYMTNNSLTDDLPLKVNVKAFADNSFNILLSSKVQNSSLRQLEGNETQMKNIKDRLGLKIDDEVKESELQKIIENGMNRSKIVEKLKMVDIPKNEDNLALQIPTCDSKINKLVIQNSYDIDERHDEAVNLETEHSKIVFSKEDGRSPSKSTPRKKSILDRLGKYGDKTSRSVMNRLGNYSRVEQDEPVLKNKIFTHLNDEKKVEYESHDRRKTKNFMKRKNNELQGQNKQDLRNQLIIGESAVSAKKRLGLSSKVTIPKVNPELLEDTFKRREVVSVVKVKPRILPPNVQQANKNLLLKAVADAQKSIAQSKSVGKDFKIDLESNSDLRLEYRNYVPANTEQKKVSQAGQEKLDHFICSQSKKLVDQEYVPTSIKKTGANVEYVPSSLEKRSEGYEDIEKKQKFVVTLDGIQKSDLIFRMSVKNRLNNRRTPSPIIFNAIESQNKTERNIPDELPVIPISYHKKEKCKYFPLCKNGEKCEYFHSVKICEQFPYCKFGDKCLFIHPYCKFGTSCTKKDCAYAHLSNGANISISAIPKKATVTKNQSCKFFPQCMNINCTFYHPKTCKYGIYCKNQSVCTYIHTHIPNRMSLSWKAE